MTEVEYRKVIWGILKDYRDDKDMTLEKLLELIMAIGTPDKKGKVTYKDKFHKELG